MSNAAVSGAGRSWAVFAAATVWLVIPALYLVLEALAATAYPSGYSYVHDFISNLGAPAHSPRADLMNVAFCLQGSAFLVGAVLLAIGLHSRRPWTFLVFAACNAVGNVLVAMVHSGQSSWVHPTGAVLAIAGGNAAALAGAALVRGERWYRSISVSLGVLGLASLFMVWLSSFGATHVLPGAVWERASVYSILGWQVLTALYLTAPASVRKLRQFCGVSRGDTHVRRQV